MGVVVIGAILLFVGLIWGVTRSSVAATERIDKQFVRLGKVCPEFLASLPEWTADWKSWVR
jgi:hypothetical protein